MSATNFSFTICSNNYLAQANALKVSFLKYHSDFLFYIILVDELVPEIDYLQFEPAKIIQIRNIAGITLDVLIEKYNIIELNTCIKPSVFKFLIKENPSAKIVYYLDPDLYFYASLNGVNTILNSKSMVLTPHILNPIERDGKMPDENIFLNFGIYNLGFIGVNPQHNETLKMLNWWEERTLNFGFDNTKKGYFVDQLWMNFTQIFYKDVEVLKSFGYNMGPWNLHERKIIKIENERVLLNDDSHLVFYHFSKLATNTIDISREFNRFNLVDFPLLGNLYTMYKNEINNFGYHHLNKIPISFNVINLPNKKIKEVDKTMNSKGSFVKRGLKRISVLISKFANNF